jgi:chemotaxis protein histidine kinase CheA
LDDIVDANGKVKKGYEGRAQYIIGKLSEATGVEIECIDGTIQQYDKLKKSIEDVMATKKAEALQNYYQGILDSFEGGVDQLSYNLADAKEQLAELETAMANTSQNTDEWAELNTQHEELIGNIEKLTGQFDTAANAQARMQELQLAIAEGDTEAMAEMYENREKFYYKDGEYFKATTDQKIRAAQEELRQKQALNDKYKDSSDKTLKQVTEINANEANKQLRKLEQTKDAEVATAYKGIQRIIRDTKEGSNIFIDVLRGAGEKGGSGYAGGIESNTDKVFSAAGSLLNSADSATSGSYSLAYGSGDDFGEGYANGIKAWFDSVYNIGKKLAQTTNQGVKDGQDSSSPSKEARKLGHDEGEGYILGVEDKLKEAKKMGTLMAETTLKAQADVSVTAIPSLNMMNLFDGMSGRDASLVYAINGLRGDIRRANLGVNTYNVNGVTYDDGSNVAGAVQTLIRAAKVERRV